MNEISEQETEKDNGEVENAGAATETRTEETRVHTRVKPSGSLRQTPWLIALVLVSLVAVAGLALWMWRQRTSGAGRPMPAPRSITLDQPGDGGTIDTAASTEPTIRLAPDQAQRAGLKIEMVGEQLAVESSGETGTGVVQANAYRETPVISVVGGIVRSVSAELGHSVQRGQTLAVIFSDEPAMAQSRYLSAVADLEEHHKHHHRTAQLVEIGAVSREEFEQATTKLRTAESEVASWRQRLLLLGLTPQRVEALRSPSQISSEISLVSPVAGTIINRSVNAGEVVEANKELLRVADLSSVWVIGQVYEKDLARIHVGSGASITTSAYPGRVFRGRISYVDPRLDPTTRTVQVRIELANPGQALKIGMFVNIAFATVSGSESIVAVVPVAAVQNIDNQQIVFVATNDPNVFTLRAVRLGPPANGSYPVLEGLSVGERIVTEGSFLLRAEWFKFHPSKS